MNPEETELFQSARRNVASFLLHAGKSTGGLRRLLPFRSLEVNEEDILNWALDSHSPVNSGSFGRYARFLEGHEPTVTQAVRIKLANSSGLYPEGTDGVRQLRRQVANRASQKPSASEIHPSQSDLNAQLASSVACLVVARDRLLEHLKSEGLLDRRGTLVRISHSQRRMLERVVSSGQR